MDSKARVAVVGATGLVGREVLAALAEANHPDTAVTAFASERSVGDDAAYGRSSLEVEAATEDSFRGQALVVLAVPAEVARTLAPAAQKAGAWVVDTSRAFLSELSVPLAAPGFRGDGLLRPASGRVVRVPGGVTLSLLRTLEPLRAAYGVTEAHVTALVGASWAGARGLAELQQTTAQLLSGRELEPTHFPHRLAFNLVPQVGPFSEASGGTLEELSWRAEVTLLWGPGAPPVDGTAVLVPIFHGALLALQVRLSKPASPAEVRELFRTVPGVKLLDEPTERVYPMPMLVTSDAAVLVGRVRASAGRPDILEVLVAVDGPALVGRAAVEAGEQLLARALTH